MGNIKGQGLSYIVHHLVHGLARQGIDQIDGDIVKTSCFETVDAFIDLALTAAVRKVFAEKPAEFDPRKYLGPARDNMEKLYKHKIVNVLGSENKLAQLD
jgi:fructose-bisphosphate aldolase class II